MGEFDLIKRYFERPQNNADDFVQLSIGDDCALVSIPPDCQLAITTDTMTENTHFLPDISAEDLAYKAIATNLSDLAAMGAQPKWISLALTLPETNEEWLSAFSQSLINTLRDYNVTLIGGDTTKGTRAITITAQGFVEKGKALCRHQAKAGDLIFYGNGSSVNHVAVYMGNGKVIHASNERNGIMISRWNYRPPVVIKNMIGD